MSEKEVAVNKKTGEVKKNIKKRIFAGQKFEDDDIVTYKVKNYVVKTGAGEDDVVVKQKVIVAEKTPRNAYINSFSGDVGIQNVLKKVALSGQDLASVVDSGRFYSKQKGLVDISKVPDNIADAHREVVKGYETFEKLPKNLKKKASFAEFAKDVNSKDLHDYIEQEVQKRMSAIKKQAEKKEGE